MEIKFFKERNRLKQFKKDIVGIFDDWKVDQYTLENQDYSLWIAHDYIAFKDYERNARKPFLTTFTPKERVLLWREFKRRRRVEIFKKFNLK